MLSEIILAGGALLARGYLEGMARAHPHRLGRVNDLLDRLQSEHPRAAYEVLWSAGDEVHKVPRLLQMVDSGGLPEDYLRVLEHGVRGRTLTIDELLGALERLVPAARSGNSQAPYAAVHLLHSQLHPPQRESAFDVLRREDRLREILPTVLELALNMVGREPNFWIHLVDDLAAVEPDRAIDLAVRALVAENYQARLLAEEFLIRLASTNPDAVMRRFGDALKSPVMSLRFRNHDVSRLLGSLPVYGIERWLEETGITGARGLARHLEAPHLDDEGRPVVPPLTAFVLERFADDEQVFREFCAGTRSVHTYHGELPTHLDHEADLARHFLRHPLKRLRAWARSKIQSVQQEAALWRQEEEEMAHP
jgi:hypothetical protein